MLTGCGSDNSQKETSEDESVSRSAVRVSTPVAPTSIGIYHDNESVRVGDEWSHAKQVFPEPPKGGYQIREMPTRFGKGYSANGWESVNGEGFGVISFEGSVVAAMTQETGVDERRVSDVVALHRKNTNELTPLTIVGRSVRYWFWSSLDGKQRLMICAANLNNKTNLTVAMGDSEVLEALGISPADARRDQSRLEPGFTAIVKTEGDSAIDMRPPIHR
jgi:hypothetical protein